MKRYSRVKQDTLCLIPKKAIAWIMLTMATLTIFSFIAIEIRRIMWLKSFTDSKELGIILNDFNRTTKDKNSLTFPDATRINISNTTVERNNLSTSRMPNSSTNLTSTTRLARTSKDIKKQDQTIFESVADLFEEQPFCREYPFLEILVASAPENFEERHAIRNTWAKNNEIDSLTFGLRVQTIFLVGKSHNRFLNVLLKNENEISGDILLGDYTDTYRNLTIKILHGLKWSLKHCHPSYVLKTDDDCFVNVPLLLNFLWKYNPIRRNLYAGRVRWSSPVVRDPKNRWYVSNEDFQSSHFMPYVNGAGYIMSLDVLEKFVDTSYGVRIFPNEDAFVGTVLNAAGVRPTYSARFVNHSNAWQVCNFLYLFVIHPVKPANQTEFQNMAKKAEDHCSKTGVVTDWV